MFLYSELKNNIFLYFSTIVLLSLSIVLYPQKASAIIVTDCNCTTDNACPISNTGAARGKIKTAGETGEASLLRTVRNAFEDYRAWFSTDFLIHTVVKDLRLFAAHMTSITLQQAMNVGTLLDSKHQLETQRTFQTLQNEAHRDYQPSSDLCQIGTNARSLASSEENARFNTAALNARQMSRHLGKFGIAGARSADQDKAARWRQFKNNYCDPQDNNWTDGNNASGLSIACNASEETNRINADIDYTRLIEQRRSLDAEFTTPNAPAAPTSQDHSFDREDIIALGNNLYGHNMLSSSLSASSLKDGKHEELYLLLRGVAARRNVAEDSYNAIVGLKSGGSSGLQTPSPNTQNFAAGVFTQMGLSSEEAIAMVGENPSYYAQLEILAKKIYQDSNFYANLYDSPANVARKGAALKAIELILDRAIYESELRQEMTTSVLLSTNLSRDFSDIGTKLFIGGDN